MAVDVHVCVHPWSSHGVEGGLSLLVGERIILKRREVEWGVGYREKEESKVS